MTTRVVVIGASSSGKSTIGRRVADRLDATFLDADDFHPAENVAKMSAGTPLDDDDRAPWLARLRDELAVRDSVVLACSALKRDYREVLRGAGGVTFVYLEIDESTARQRAERRAGHFMRADMIESQFDTLEPPAPDETDVVTVDAHPAIDDVVEATIDALATNR